MHERIPYYLQRMHDLCVDIQSFIDGIELEDFFTRQAHTKRSCHEFAGVGRSGEFHSSERC